MDSISLMCFLSTRSAKWATELFLGHTMRLGGHLICIRGYRGYCFVQKKLSFILLPKNGWELTPNGEKIHIRGRWGNGGHSGRLLAKQWLHCGTHCNSPLQGDEVRKGK